MAKPKIYIETTIPNFYFDFKNQSIEKKIETSYFWNNNLSDFEAVTSLATIRELEAVPDAKWKEPLLMFADSLPVVEINDSVIVLAEEYVAHGLVPQRYSADAIHLAVAIINKIDYLLTWNIQHLAHPTKRKSFRDYNASKGLYVTEIVTPQELNVKIKFD